MTTFDKAFNFLLELEGGYVNDKDDSGGETKYGITKKEFPNLDIKNLTIEQAKEIYYKNYWLKSKSAIIEKYNAKLSIIHFVTAVNDGIKSANKILQRAINKQGHGLKVDGIIGEKTLSALHLCEYEILNRDYILETIARYLYIADKHLKNRKFLRGWIRRALRLRNICGC